jgi:hypothetical protein
MTPTQAERSMALALLLAFQTAASVPLAVPSDFDLAKVKASEDPDQRRACRGGDSAEILVCGRRRPGNDYPFEEMERLFREKPIRAEVGIGGGATARAYVDQVEMPQGQVSKRIMIGIKMPF